MRKSKRIITRTVAFAKKEFKLATRYKWKYLSTTIIIPGLSAIPLIILYWGIVSHIPAGLTFIDAGNYLAWVLLGSLIYSIYTMGYSDFSIKFTAEKYWMTIYGTIIAPVSKYYLLFGAVIELWIRSMVTSAVFFIVCYIAYPTAFINLLYAYVILFIAMSGAVGIGLISGTVYLINENLSPFFTYALYILVFLSTYSIPLELYPGFLYFFIYANPLFHYINLCRDFWIVEFETPINPLWSFLYVIGFTIVCLIIGVYFFNKFARRFGVRGY